MHLHCFFFYFQYPGKCGSKNKAFAGGSFMEKELNYSLFARCMCSGKGLVKKYRGGGEGGVGRSIWKCG